MAYKKFIKRHGKIYGPYNYESRREGNKVVTNYLGREEKKKINFIFWTSITLLFLMFIVLMKLFYPTGRIIMEMPDVSYTNESIVGQVALDLKQGELIPSDSIVKLKLNNQQVEHSLSSLLKDEKQTGNFFIEGKSLQGSSEG